MWRLLNIMSMIYLIHGQQQIIAPPTFHENPMYDVDKVDIENPLFYSHVPNTITHLYVAPNSYICTCITINTAMHNPTLNASAWDNTCTNIQKCTWNKEETLIRTWYHHS